MTPTEIKKFLFVEKNAKKIEQIDSSNLFILIMQDDSEILYSYRTIVGRKREGIWNLTTEFFSITTTKQLNKFARYHCNNEVLWIGEIL